MTLFSRYEQWLFGRFREAGKHGGLDEIRFHGLIIFGSILPVLLVAHFFEAPLIVLRIVGIIWFGCLLVRLFFVWRTGWRVHWEFVAEEPVIEKNDG